MLKNFQDFLNKNNDSELIPSEKFEEIRAMEPQDAMAAFIELLRENSKGLSNDEIKELLYGKEAPQSWKDFLTETQKYHLKTKKELTADEQELRLSLKGFTAAYSLFRKSGIKTIADIPQFCSLGVMNRAKNFGSKTMKKMYEVLASKGLTFRESDPTELDDSIFALYVTIENTNNSYEIYRNYLPLPLEFLVDNDFRRIKELSRITENEFYKMLDSYDFELNHLTLEDLYNASITTKVKTQEPKNFFEDIAQNFGFKLKPDKEMKYIDRDVLNQLASKERNRLRAEINKNVLEWMNRFKVNFLAEEG
jgi:DNA-binding transcriptional MerR regulator